MRRASLLTQLHGMPRFPLQLFPGASDPLRPPLPGQTELQLPCSSEADWGLLRLVPTVLSNTLPDTWETATLKDRHGRILADGLSLQELLELRSSSTKLKLDQGRVWSDSHLDPEQVFN